MKKPKKIRMAKRRTHQRMVVPRPPVFLVNVTYQGEQSRPFDEFLRHIAQLDGEGSGYDFTTNTRDISWETPDEHEAEEAIRRLRALPLRIHITSRRW